VPEHCDARGRGNDAGARDPGLVPEDADAGRLPRWLRAYAEGNG
jgi:hypothetical protein